MQKKFKRFLSFIMANVNVTKGMIPSATGDMLKSAVETYLNEKDEAGFKGVNLYDGISGLWNPNVLWVKGYQPLIKHKTGKAVETK